VLVVADEAAGGSAESVVLPVPERPKKSAVTPSAPTLAEQCMGSTASLLGAAGSRKFITPKMDFFISPAYLVPPMRTMRRVKSARMKAPVRVPSRSGTASNSGAAMTVNSARGRPAQRHPGGRKAGGRRGRARRTRR
jgi:hypothetical protein